MTKNENCYDLNLVLRLRHRTDDKFEKFFSWNNIFPKQCMKMSLVGGAEGANEIFLKYSPVCLGESEIVKSVWELHLTLKYLLPLH